MMPVEAALVLALVWGLVGFLAGMQVGGVK